MKAFTTLAFTLMIHFFVHAQLSRYSVVINELMADPSPVVGLPNTEFIELRNNSKLPINLYKWRISNGSTTASINTSYILQPDSIVVICSKTQTVFFNGLSNIIGVTSFPSLSNDGDVISLTASDGTTMHAVSYSLNDYHNNLKAAGGWSLEMINPFKGCDKNNWTASTYFAGGTPGRENSVFNKSTGEEKIHAVQAIANDATHVQLHLDQGADSALNTLTGNYFLTPSHEMPMKITLEPPLFNIINLQFGSPLQDHTIYAVQSNTLRHCNSSMADTFSIQTGIMHSAEAGDLVINEILFDPPSGGSDFVELYNNSKNIINAKTVYIANRTSSGLIGTAFAAAEEDISIFPGKYLALTTDSSFLLRQWTASPRKHIHEVKSMPSFPDVDGHVILMNQQGKIIDEVAYHDNMHFPLIRNREGVSLERISANLPSNYISNWHSAASVIGYASPGYQNSQFQPNDSSQSTFRLSTDVVTPNNDGTDDNLIILYTFPSSGYMCSVYLFNERGVLLQKICDNILCGIEGQFIWNGTVQDQKTPSGMYYIKLEAFHLNGSRIGRKWAVGVK